jgi:BTB/POZ domain
MHFVLVFVFHSVSKLKSSLFGALFYHFSIRRTRPFDEFNKDIMRNYLVGFKQLLSSGEYSDFTIVVSHKEDKESKEFAVHKCVLAAQSSVFAAIFNNDMKEKQTGKMEIDNFAADTVEGMLQFIYTGQLKDESNAMDLFTIAAQYDIDSLKISAEDLIVCNTDESNAAEVFALGHLHNSDKMKRAAVKVIQKLFPERDRNESLMVYLEPKEIKELMETHLKLQEVQAEMYLKLMVIKIQLMTIALKSVNK